MKNLELMKSDLAEFVEYDLIPADVIDKFNNIIKEIEDLETVLNGIENHSLTYAQATRFYHMGLLTENFVDYLKDQWNAKGE